MPRKARTRPSVKRTKTYTGCWTCRKRGVKCDTARPTCARCQKSQRVCEGYGIKLLWNREEVSASSGKHRLLFSESDRYHPTFSDDEIDAAIQSLDSMEIDWTGCQDGPFVAFRCASYIKNANDAHDAHGSTDDLSSPCSDLWQISPPSDSDNHFPICDNATECFAPQYSEAGANARLTTSAILSNCYQRGSCVMTDMMEQKLRPFFEPIVVSSIPEERRLFHHWVTSASGILISTGHPDNPYQNFVIRLALSAASSSSPEHMAFNSALLHSIYALACFNLNRIHRSGDVQQAAIIHQEISIRHLRYGIAGSVASHSTSFLATAILLAVIETISGQFTSWRIHLNAARKWLRSLGRARTKDEDVLGQMLRVLEVLGSNEERMADPSPPSEIEPIGASSDTQSSIMTNNGDVDYIQSYFGVTNPMLDIISEINWRSRRPCMGTPAELLALRNRLLLTNPLTLCFPSPTKSMERLTRQNACAFYIACNIYYERLIACRSSRDLQHLVEQGLYHLETINTLEEDKNVAGLIWPVYIIACEADSNDLRQRSLQVFARRLKQGIGGVDKIRAVTIEVWRRRDLGDINDPQSRFAGSNAAKAMGVDLLLS